MSGSRYINDTSFSTTLQSAVSDFEKALTKRWREVMTDVIVAGELSFPQRIEGPGVPPHSTQQIWEYWKLPARHHLRGTGGECAYVQWVRDGQNGSLGAVTCDGDTGAYEEVELVDIDSGETVTIPPNIECGVGSILEQVENWAFNEREHLFYELPLFDSHDVRALEEAHDSLIEVGGKLGLEAKAGSSEGLSFDPTSERELVGKVEDLAGQRGQGKDWWTGWTGLSASRAKDGFFSSVMPTINNQSGIVGSAANLYSDRAAIIEKGRNDSLYWVQWATKALDEKTEVTTDLVNGWKTVNGIGTAISATGAWFPVTGAVGIGLILVGFLGENLLPELKREEYKSGMEEVVSFVNHKITELKSELDSFELDYASAVNRLKTTIFGIHSYNLELYDLTENSADGDRGGETDGYTADVEDILAISKACYDAGEMYDKLLSPIAHLSDADKSLADRDGSQTPADKALIEVCDMLHDFVKTTASRYLVAGDQVKAAAEAYAQQDSDQQAAFRRIMSDWEDADVGEYDVDYNPGKEAGETDRSDSHPGGGHPSTGGRTPGAGDGEGYETERDS